MGMKMCPLLIRKAVQNDNVKSFTRLREKVAIKSLKSIVKKLESLVNNKKILNKSIV